MSMPFDVAAIRALAAILTETGLTEIEIADKETRLRVVRAPAQVIAGVTSGQAFAALPVAEVPQAPTSHTRSDAGHPGAVTSPMVGVAYLSAEPGTAAYVSVGSVVAAGQTLLLIEAMKTYNQIKAPRAGTVSRILVTSGAAVEFGEPLLIIE